MLRQENEVHKCATYLLKELMVRKDELRELNRTKEELVNALEE
jgi:hypothetical protein